VTWFYKQPTMGLLGVLRPDWRWVESTVSTTRSLLARMLAVETYNRYAMAMNGRDEGSSRQSLHGAKPTRVVVALLCGPDACAEPGGGDLQGVPLNVHQYWNDPVFPVLRILLISESSLRPSVPTGVRPRSIVIGRWCWCGGQARNAKGSGFLLHAT
jgi:hypothetical protein